MIIIKKLGKTEKVCLKILLKELNVINNKTVSSDEISQSRCLELIIDSLVSLDLAADCLCCEYI